jgi:TRAP-type C4-dicarboxylate transport system permease small subunit
MKIREFINYFLITLLRVPRYAAFFSGLAILLVTLMITFDVLMRYFFNKPQLFVDELATLILVFIIFGGIAYTFQRNGHIRVDLLIERLKEKTKHRLRILTLLLGIGLLGVVTENTIISSFSAYHYGRQSMVLFCPLWIPMLIIPFGTGLMSISMIKELINECRKAKREPHEKNNVKELGEEGN